MAGFEQINHLCLTEAMSHSPWADPPGFRDTCADMSRPSYGWAVITSPGGASGARIAIIEVKDWQLALRTMPYRWLNVHPRQPASVNDTAELVEETLARIAKRSEKLTPID